VIVALNSARQAAEVDIAAPPGSEPLVDHLSGGSPEGIPRRGDRLRIEVPACAGRVIAPRELPARPA